MLIIAFLSLAKVKTANDISRDDKRKKAEAGQLQSHRQIKVIQVFNQFQIFNNEKKYRHSAWTGYYWTQRAWPGFN